MRRKVHRDAKPEKSSSFSVVAIVGALALGAVGVFSLQGGSATRAEVDDEALVEQLARERIEPWFQTMRRGRIEITAEALRAQVERAKPFVREDIRVARIRGKRDGEIKAEFDAKLEGR